MPQTKATVSIENVVASASINEEVDLNQTTKSFLDVEYHSDQFPGLVFRLKTRRRRPSSSPPGSSSVRAGGARASCTGPSTTRTSSLKRRT